MNYEFDIEEDEMGTIKFCMDANRWRGDLYSEDGMDNVGSDYFNFKDGELWRHNEEVEGRNAFFGQEVSSFLGVVGNLGGGKIKTLQTFSLEGNNPPVGVFFRTTIPIEQNSSIPVAHFKTRNGVVYAEALRDVDSPGGIYKGERLRGPFVYCLIEFEASSLLSLRSFSLGYRSSPGHEFI